ncbi:MAG: DinB family protein [Bacteroidetes bacterium]|nr:DinB family protein [Bacteroidota bacterium]
MTPDMVLANFEATVQPWIESLPNYTSQQFASTPEENAWSIGQVYEHLVSGTRNFHLRMVEACLNGQGERTEEPANENGQRALAANSFPPVRIAVPPSPQYTPVQPAGPEDVAARLGSLVVDLRTYPERVAGADPNMKMQHPGLGKLNAQEWYQLIEMHFRHHLAQKGRLDEWLNAPVAAEG